MKAVFYLLWMIAVPTLASLGSVWLLTPADETSDVGVLRKFVGGQKIPATIILFMLFAMIVWRMRHDLPLSYAIGPGRRDLPPKLRGRYEEALTLLEESQRILKTQKKDVERELTKSEREQVTTALDELERSMSENPFNPASFEAAHARADRACGEHLSRWRKGEIREYAESILIAISIALVLRVAVVEPFKIPSGSMIPTLMIGDHIFVNKFSYGPLLPFTEKRILTNLPPERADVMVFKFPENPDQDFIKRTIATPGDTLEVLDSRPVINGWLVPHCHVGTFQSEGKSKELYVEFLAGKSYFTLFNSMGREETCKQQSDCANGQMCLSSICVSERKGPYKVAPNEVWVLGDNRDNSHDSRGWRGGLGAGVPFENIKGRAMFVFATFGPDNGDFWDRFLVNVMGRPQLPTSQMQLQPAVDKCLREAPKDTTPPPPKAAP